MSSDPELRKSIAEKIKEAGGTVSAVSIPDLKHALGMDEVTNTQFSKALGSLHYNPGPVRLCRPHTAHMKPRPYAVRYMGS